MKAIVVMPKSRSEFKFITELLQKLGIGSSTLTEAEIEDIGMAKLLNQADKTKKVSRSVVMKAVGIMKVDYLAGLITTCII